MAVEELNRITEAKLKKLPPRAILVLIVRCARRVQPIVQNLNSQEIVVINRVLHLIEEFCAGREDKSQKIKASIRLLNNNAYKIFESPADIIQAAVHATVRVMDAQESSFDDGSLDISDVASTFDFKFLPIEHIAPLNNALTEDYEILFSKRDWLTVRSNFAGRKVDLKKSKWLGPLWPKGEPDWFIESKRKLNERLSTPRQPVNTRKPVRKRLESQNDKSNSVNKTLDVKRKDTRLSVLEMQYSQLESKINKIVPDDFLEKQTIRSKDILTQIDSAFASLQSVVDTQDTLQQKMDEFLPEMQSIESKCRTELEKKYLVLKNEIETLVSNQQEIISNLKSSYELVDHRQKVIENKAEESSGKVEAFLESAKATLDAQALVEEPITYWGKKAKFHYWSFCGYSILTCLAGVGGLGGIYWQWEKLIAAQEPKSWQIGFVLFAGTVLLLLLRILTRITMSNLHLATEASERKVMMKAYLGLLKQNKLDESEDRSLVLNALFRPSTTGLVKEDAVPASVLDLATRISAQGTKTPKSSSPYMPS